MTGTTISEKVGELERNYSDKCVENARLSAQIEGLKKELQGTRDALAKHVDDEKKAAAVRDSLLAEVSALTKKLDDMPRRVATPVSSDPMVRCLMELPTWKGSDAYEFEGSETWAVLFCVRSFMEEKGITTAKELENLLESAQGCRDLRGKFRDMADAFDDWTNEMPSIDPDDY